MKYLFFFFISFCGNTLLSQELSPFSQDRLDLCDSKLSDSQTIQLRKELNDFEEYLIDEGILRNRSGASYREVFKRIASDDDLNFQIDTTFELLHSLDLDVYTMCFYKVLDFNQLNELTPRHLEAAKRISAPEENISPGIIAQRILDNLTNEDFELEFYKVSALMVFYRTATPSLEFELPNFNNSSDTDIETIKVFLSKNNEIIISDTIFAINEAKNKIYDFVSSDPHKRGIELKAERGATYEAYIELTYMFNSIYNELQSKNSTIKKKIFIIEPE